MRKMALGAVAVLGLAALSYAAVIIPSQNEAKAAAIQPRHLSPQDVAARDRMAQLVAEVAARTAATTAKQVVLNRSRPQQLAATEVAQKSAGR
jgi:hypothetical protein